MFRKTPRPIVITHVSKTAGTSLHYYLRRILGDRLILDYRVHPLPEPHGVRKLLYRLGYQRAALPRDVVCVMGHFPSTKYDRILPGARHAIWFRDPAERIVSLWEYNRRNVGLVQQDWSQVDLMDFASRAEHRNMQTATLAGRGLTEFDMVGVAEHFELSVHLFTKIFDLQPPDEIPTENVNPNRPGKRYHLAADERQQILDWNQEDLRLHKYATDVFRTLCMEYGIVISKEADQAA